MIRAENNALGSAPAVVDDVPARKSPLTPRNIIILVGVVAWLAVLLLFVLPALTRKPAAPAASGEAVAAKPAAAAQAAISEQAAAGGVGAAPKAIPGPQLSIPNRVFNLSGTSAGFKYVKLSVVVQFEDEGGKFAKAKGEAGKKLQDEFTAENAGTLGAFNDILTTVVSSKTAAELATAQGKESLRQELITKFNAALAGNPAKEHVSYVIFSDFVMQ
jgi:flagellar basal body-associated protein FliL